jgi:hypothetical protein
MPQAYFVLYAPCSIFLMIFFPDRISHFLPGLAPDYDLLTYTFSLAEIKVHSTMLSLFVEIQSCLQSFRTPRSECLGL